MKFLSWTWSFGRLRGVDFRFHFSILFSIPIAYSLFHPVDFRETVVAFLWLAGFILSIFLHELGHALTAQLAGVEVKSIVLWLLGGFTNLTRKAEKPSHNLAIFSAGPLVNMLLAFLFVFFFMIVSFGILPNVHVVDTFLWLQTINNLAFSLALVNLILIVFNLLPIYPLDGGNILHAAMEMAFDRPKADLITLIISLPILLGLFAFGLLTRDYLLLVSCLFIALATSTLNRPLLRRMNLALNYFFKRSGYYYLQGDFERAAQYYTKDIEREPQNPNPYLARAACLINILQKERAVSDIDRALKLAPQNTLALQLRGEMYTLEKDHEAALEFFARAQAVNPNWAVPYFDRGSVFLDRREFQAALEQFNKAIALSSQTWLYHLVRSIAHFKLGDLESAHKDQDSALRLSEKESLAMTDLNMIVYEGCLDWAEDYYQRVLTKRPGHGFAFQGRADAYRVNAQHDKAIADYTRAIEILPKEPALYAGRGKSYLAINDLEKAMMDFHQFAAVADKLHLKRQAQELLNKVAAAS
ncbi:MAG: M50 family metallopeptidase [Chloroflexi bacterium]|nr:M50 family metallopeptidase [Chloroflexota bacterium]